MPKVERSGIYRDENGRALWLRKGTIVNDVIAASFTFDADAELTETRQAIIAAEERGAPSLGEEVESVETSTAIFPAVVEDEPEVPAEPVPVAPGKRKRGKAEDRALHTIDAPENVAPVPEDREAAPVADAPIEDGGDSDGDGKSDADEAADSSV